MKFEQVSIENFCQYKGSQPTLFFAKTKDKNVTLIYGLNGAGKSNLFKAINWCIYGNSVLPQKGDIANKEAVEQSRPGEAIPIKVQVRFSHKGETFVMSRSCSCRKNYNGEIQYDPDGLLMQKIASDGRTKEIDNPVGIVNSILPENVRTYFLFDGEKIDNFSKPESADDVKNAIYKVLKLEILERGRKHLEDVASEVRSELRNIANVALQKLIEQFEAKKEDKNNIEKRQNEIEKEINLVKGKLLEINKHLEGLKESKQLQLQRKRLEEEKVSKEKNMEELIESLQKLATSPATNINKKFLQKAISLLDQKRIKGEIPSNIRQQFLQDVIESKSCICGRAFVSVL